MEDRFILGVSWLFTILGLFTMNGFAILISIVASLSVVIKNRKSTAAFIQEVINKLKR